MQPGPTLTRRFFGKLAAIKDCGQHQRRGRFSELAQVTDEELKAGGVGNGRLQIERSPPRNVVTFQNPGQFVNRLLKARIFRSTDTHLNHSLQAKSETIRVDYGVVAGDDSGIFQAAKAFGRSRRRKSG